MYPREKIWQLCFAFCSCRWYRYLFLFSFFFVCVSIKLEVFQAVTAEVVENRG